ncbi:MAG: methyltransferase domain-containing protein, partial [Pseudomonadota bacterium]
TLASIPTASVDVVLSSMALHHLPDTAALAQCLGAVERVLTPGGRVFIADFGRIRSLKSVEYFVARAIPRDEPVLERDYRASLRAAFSPQEMHDALPPGLSERLALHATALSPVMMVLKSPYADTRGPTMPSAPMPFARRADRAQLRLFFQLGGMPLR